MEEKKAIVRNLEYRMSKRAKTGAAAAAAEEAEESGGGAAAAAASAVEPVVPAKVRAAFFFIWGYLTSMGEVEEYT